MSLSRSKVALGHNPESGEDSGGTKRGGAYSPGPQGQSEEVQTQINDW